MLEFGNNEVASAIDKGVYIVRSQEELEKTSAPENTNQVSQRNEHSKKILRFKGWCNKATPIVLHYVVLFILGLLTWLVVWFVFGEEWQFWKGRWFRLVLIALVAWASTIVCQAVALPEMLAPLILGIFVRNIGYLDMREFADIDEFLRKIYPAIILGKGPLLWNLPYMKENWLKITCLGALPWLSEVCTMSICMRYIRGYSWLEGVEFGCLFATVAGPVIVPAIKPIAHDLKRKWVALIGSSAGLDVALSVGVYGMVKSYSVAEENSVYNYIKLVLTPFVGVVLGIAWGYLAGVMPHVKDFYVAELRVLFLVIPGSFANFFGAYVEWGGASSIAILVCSAVAARQWIKKGWNHHENPAVKAYRIMWAATEPVLFVYTGTYFVLNEATFHTMKFGIVILLLCVTVKIIVASQVCWDMNWREKLVICCCWPCKTIVQAVLCPIPLIVTITYGGTKLEVQFAEEVLVISIMSILIMTPTSFLATKYLGRILLRNQPKDEHRLSHAG